MLLSKRTASAEVGTPSAFQLAGSLQLAVSAPPSHDFVAAEAVTAMRVGSVKRILERDCKRVGFFGFFGSESGVPRVLSALDKRHG